MPDEKPMMVDFHLNRIGKHRYIQFYCKVIPHPQIVVACKEEDGDSPFSQCCYFAYKADKTLWDNLVVFKPKIKNIPQQKNGCRIILYVGKPSDDLLFPFPTGNVVGSP